MFFFLICCLAIHSCTYIGPPCLIIKYRFSVWDTEPACWKCLIRLCTMLVIFTNILFCKPQKYLQWSTMSGCILSRRKEVEIQPELTHGSFWDPAQMDTCWDLRSSLDWHMLRSSPDWHMDLFLVTGFCSPYSSPSKPSFYEGRGTSTREDQLPRGRKRRMNENLVHLTLPVFVEARYEINGLPNFLLCSHNRTLGIV